mgnify:CR=1 FL=1
MRSYARETVFKYTFSQLFNPDDEGLFSVLLSEGKVNGKLSDSDAEFATELLKYIEDNSERYIDKISDLSIGFKIERVLNADKCAIMLGMAELDFYKDTPVPVIIDEAVKIVAKYSTEKSTDYVNGILSTYAKETRNG